MSILDKIVKEYISKMEQADNGGMALSEVLRTYDNYAQTMCSKGFYEFPCGVNGKFMEGIVYLYEKVGIRVKYIGDKIDCDLDEVQSDAFLRRPAWIAELFRHALKKRFSV